VFVTTTCLDFSRAFQREEMRELATLSIVRDVQRYRATLSAFVVMPHHIHLLATCPTDRTVSWLMQRLKSNLAKLALPRLIACEHGELAGQTGLNQRTFWKPGFRALPILSERAFSQKVRYIHLNPVRAELVQEAADYRWSSRRFWDAGMMSSVVGLDLARVLEGFDQSISTTIID
jgi:putative transposase